MTREDAIAAIERSSLARHTAALQELLLPSVRVRANRLGPGEPMPRSRFGGWPLLPHGAEWPVWDAAAYYATDAARWERRTAEKPRQAGSGLHPIIEQMRAEAARGVRPLAFIGQIDLGDVAGEANLPGIPKQGILAFFYEADRCPGSFDPLSRGCGRVIYTDDPAAEVQPPSSLSSDLQFAPCRLGIEQQWTLPDNVEVTQRSLFGRLLAPTVKRIGIWNDEGYAGLHRQLVGSEPLHRLGGHPQEVQGDMRLECQLASNGVYCGRPEDYQTPQAKALRPGADDWQLLLQVDSDEVPGWMWGDAGRLYFWIRRQDLRRQDFSHVWPVMQCY